VWQMVVEWHTGRLGLNFGVHKDELVSKSLSQPPQELRGIVVGVRC
jgi:hypothetical protein